MYFSSLAVPPPLSPTPGSSPPRAPPLPPTRPWGEKRERRGGRDWRQTSTSRCDHPQDLCVRTVSTDVADLIGTNRVCTKFCCGISIICFFLSVGKRIPLTHEEIFSSKNLTWSIYASHVFSFCFRTSPKKRYKMPRIEKYIHYVVKGCTALLALAVFLRPRLRTRGESRLRTKRRWSWWRSQGGKRIPSAFSSQMQWGKKLFDVSCDSSFIHPRPPFRRCPWTLDSLPIKTGNVTRAAKYTSS